MKRVARPAGAINDAPYTGMISTKPKGRTRWSVALLLGFGILINYIDRLSISVTQQPLSEEFGLNATEFGVISAAFLWTYAIMQIPAGMLLDRFGVRKVWGLAAFLWTVSSALTAVASGAWMLILARVFLGVAEAPAMPGAMKATGTWFPRYERGLCTAIFDSGTRLANVIGLPLIAFAVATWGWREAFWIQAALSVIFLFVFLWKYRGPRAALDRGRLSAEEFRYIREGGASNEEVRPQSDLKNVGYLLKQRKVWGMSLGLAGAGYVLWMLLTWLPGYMQTGMDKTVLQSGLFAAIPALAMFVSELTIGGLWIDRKLRNGADGNVLRKAVIVGGMIVALFTVGAAFTDNAVISIVWISIGSAGIALVYVTTNSLPALVAPEGSEGAMASIVNCVNLLAGVAAPILTGVIVDITGSFAWAFGIGGFALVGGLLSYVLLMGKIEPIRPRQAAMPGPGAEQ